MSYEPCRFCGVWSRPEEHRCPPQWLVWCPDYGQNELDARTVYARDSEQAATKWAEQSDRDGDYSIVGGSSVTAHVRRSDVAGAPVEVCTVMGDSVPQYHAQKVGGGE